ncbi:MAG: hypothetical protein H0X26_01135 [Alphaproteobacteria bacterium]|nr:hypothetical protein [Alphaproteobacteria bacterium]
MREKFILLLTDDEIILYKGAKNHTYGLAEGIESLQSELKNVLSLSPKVPLCLLIDRNHQDIREEQLPALMLWDRLRLLSHKREEWTSQGEFHGYHFFKQGGQSFLQWVNITQNDPLTPWFLWIKSLSNPLEGALFVSLEAGRFLKKYCPSTDNYHVIIYKTSQRIRYAIFKDKRFLLCRPFSGEEDLRTSLHFLSRLYPDIHEKLQVLNLIKEISLTLPHIITLPDPSTFINFLSHQTRGTLSLNIKTSSQNQWIGRVIKFIFICSLLLTGIFVHQSLEYKQETDILCSKMGELKRQIQRRKVLLKNKNVLLLQSALAHYHYLQSQLQLPFKTLEILGSVLDKHRLRLQSLIWLSEKSFDMEISFFMPGDKNGSLADAFNDLLFSLAKAFPKSQIQVIEAPFKSGPHETYEYPSSLCPPVAHLRIGGL